MKKSFRFNNKALSPVIATVLLISLVVVLASIIFLWARGFVTERIEKFGENIESVCGRVDFDIQLSKENSLLEVVNRGNVPINNLEIREIQENGDYETSNFNLLVDIGESGSQNIFLSNNIVKIILYPKILGSGKTQIKEYTCLDNGRTVTF